MERYPILKFVVEHGARVAAGTAGLIVLLGFFGVLLYGDWLWGAIAGIAAAIAYLLIRSYAELVDLVTDMLLPK